MTTTVDQTFAEWVILELLGHRRLGGHLTEVTIAGAGFLRLDIPAGNGQPPMTQIVNPSSVYAITPTTEDIARRVATLGRPSPVSRWELAAAPVHDEDDDADEDEGPF
jgi:hypothetical protein